MNRSADATKLKGVEKLLSENKIVGYAADQIREWAKDSLYWNAMILLDPMDIVTEAMGAKDARALEDGLRNRIERKLGLLP
jgi:hypothetical protein